MSFLTKTKLLQTQDSRNYGKIRWLINKQFFIYLLSSKLRSAQKINIFIQLTSKTEIAHHMVIWEFISWILYRFYTSSCQNIAGRITSVSEIEVWPLMMCIGVSIKPPTPHHPLFFIKPHLQPANQCPIFR